MAISKCAKCDNTHFEVVEQEPTGSQFKIMFVQCSSCGSVLGVLEFYSVGYLVKNLETKVDKILNGINRL